jgi:predicted nucleic acid-binding protein
MSSFYLDSSALTKRYLTETGSKWIDTITDPQSGNTIIVAEITRVEVAAAFAARQRAPGGISRKRRDEAVSLLLQHFNSEYQITPVNPRIIGHAVDLTQTYRLRGYDAVQLATALDANATLTAAGLTVLTFIAADSDLLAAARAEGLLVDNPNLHP